MKNEHKFQREFNQIAIDGIIREIIGPDKCFEIENKKDYRVVVYQGNDMKISTHIFCKYFDLVFWKNRDVEDVYRLYFDEDSFEFAKDLLMEFLENHFVEEHLKKLKKIKQRKILRRH